MQQTYEQYATLIISTQKDLEDLKVAKLLLESAINHGEDVDENEKKLQSCLATIQGCVIKAYKIMEDCINDGYKDELLRDDRINGGSSESITAFKEVRDSMKEEAEARAITTMGVVLGSARGYDKSRLESQEESLRANVESFQEEQRRIAKEKILGVSNIVDGDLLT